MPWTWLERNFKVPVASTYLNESPFSSWTLEQLIDHLIATPMKFLFLKVIYWFAHLEELFGSLLVCSTSWLRFIFYFFSSDYFWISYFFLGWARLFSKNQIFVWYKISFNFFHVSPAIHLWLCPINTGIVWMNLEQFGKQRIWQEKYCCWYVWLK